MFARVQAEVVTGRRDGHGTARPCGDTSELDGARPPASERDPSAKAVGPMGAKSRRKGYAFEHAVSTLLKERGWHCTRHYQRVANNTDPDLTAAWETERSLRIVRVECKNRATMPAKCDAEALDQALASSGPGIAVACVKRAGVATSEAVVLMRLEDFLGLVESLG